MSNFSFLDYVCIGYFNIYLQNANSLPLIMLKEKGEQDTAFSL